MTGLSTPEAALYLRSLILPASRRACLAYWRYRYGEKWVAAVEAQVRK